MKIVKDSLILSLTLVLLVACNRSDSIKQENDAIAAEQIAAQERAQIEADKLTAEKRAQVEADKLAAEKRAQVEADKLAETKRAQAEADKIAAQERAQAEAEKSAAEQRAQAEAERLATLVKKDKLYDDEIAKRDKAKSEKFAAEQRLKAEKIKAEKLAAEKLAAERLAEEKALLAKQEESKNDSKAGQNEAVVITNKTSFKAYDFSKNSGIKTAVGAQKVGNSAGTIPAWNGGITKPPAGYKKGDHHQDPYLQDKILFTIDSSNYKEYSDRLSVGQNAMFEKYPDTWKMNVYKSRRSASFPDRIYQKTIQNGKVGSLSSDGEGVVNVAEGFPFPNPKNAYELILNHKLKYKGFGGVRYNNQVAPTATGRYTVVKLREEILGKYYAPGTTIDDINNILFYFYQVVESPARLAGRILLVHETINQKETPRQAWIYNPGQRRVRRAPNVAYDNPGTASDGLRTNDMTDMFNGAMDRFDWVIVDKKEMIVPYNSYKVHSGDLDYADIVQPGHLNQDLMRYELHRVWVIEAILKDGMRHINSRRTFYLDEDSYQILLTDHYDKRGSIWRFSEAHSINYYDVPTFWSTVEVHHDLRSGRYVAVGLDNKEPVNTFNVPLSDANYTPQALRKRGRR